MNAIDIIGTFPVRKAELQDYAALVKDGILHSDKKCELAAVLKAMEDFFGLLRDDPDIKAAIQKEFEKYGMKTVEFADFKMTRVDRATKDYSGCNDQPLAKLQQEETRIKEAIKARKTMLDNGLDPFTGEILTRPVSVMKEYLTITLR